MTSGFVHVTGPFLVLFCGSRDYDATEFIGAVLDELLAEPNLMVLHGGARGADLAADSEAKKRGVAVVRVDANWKQYGKPAGPLRNRWMAALRPDLILAFHDDIAQSKGTKDMVQVGTAFGIPTHVFDDPTEHPRDVVSAILKDLAS